MRRLGKRPPSTRSMRHEYCGRMVAKRLFKFKISGNETHTPGTHNGQLNSVSLNGPRLNSSLAKLSLAAL